MKSFFLLLCFLCISGYIHAQYPCGTLIDQEKMKELKESYQVAESNYKWIRDETFYIPLKLHVIRNTDGTGGINVADVYRSVDSANYYFKNASIQFTICDTINYIDNSNFFTYESTEEEELTKNDIPNSINIYYADTVIINDNVVCGYSYLPMGPLRVFLTKVCVNRGNTLTHELGHIFSLIHTHGSSNDELTDELVDGSNCTTAGDYICDTPSDPNLSGHKVDAQCVYTKNEKDANGDIFQPLTDNIMSYSPPNCVDSMTPQQYQKIYGSLFQHKRTDLICSLSGNTGNKIEATYPNPFDKEITILYQLNEDGWVAVTLYNVLGMQVETLFEGEQQKGLFKIYHTFDSSFRFPHLYFLKLEINGKIADAERLIKWD